MESNVDRQRGCPNTYSFTNQGKEFDKQQLNFECILNLEKTILKAECRLKDLK